MTREELQCGRNNVRVNPKRVKTRQVQAVMTSLLVTDLLKDGTGPNTFQYVQRTRENLTADQTVTELTKSLLLTVLLARMLVCTQLLGYPKLMIIFIIGTTMYFKSITVRLIE